MRYLVTGGTGFIGAYAVRELVEAVAWVRQLLPEADLQVSPGGTHRGIRYDGSVTEAAIGYSPQYTMEDGFRKTINTTREQHGLPAV
jgi:nucleoside-diphosphate-sugar epimerase